MISSEDGLEILRNWQTQRTLLWLVSFEFSDSAHGPEVRVSTVSKDPLGAVLAIEESAEVEPLDLEEAEFDEATPEDSPFKDIPPETLVRFLYIRLRDGRLFALVERKQGGNFQARG